MMTDTAQDRRRQRLERSLILIHDNQGLGFVRDLEFLLSADLGITTRKAREYLLVLQYRKTEQAGILVHNGNVYYRNENETFDQGIIRINKERNTK